jgi:hypothetical protein
MRTSSIFPALEPKILGAPQGLVNHVGQALVNHASGCRAGDGGLTSLFKRFRNGLGYGLAYRPGT